jgi:hypothetical protein
MFRIIDTTDKKYIGAIVDIAPMSSLVVILGDGQVMEVVQWIQVSSSIFKAINFNYTILVEELSLNGHIQRQIE